MNLEKIAEDNLIFKTLVGAQMYGLVTPNSDRDEIGVFIPPKDFVIGTHTVEQVEIRTNPTSSGKRNTKDDIDLTIYTLPKLFILLGKASPNTVELLFTPQNCILHTSKWWKRILDEKEIFLSLKIKHSFGGYAYSQRKKVIAKKKTYEEYVSYIDSGKSKEEAMMMLKDPIGGRIEYYEKFGYDVKFMSHSLRLLYSGLELLKEGRLALPLNQNNLILDVKEGKYKLNEVLEMIEELNSYLEKAYITSELRSQPDMKRINDLQIELLEDYWNSN